MYVLGLNAGHAASHDTSACLVDSSGRVLAFIEEERISRVRHAAGSQPLNAIQRCLQLAGITAADIDAVAVGWDEPRMSARVGDTWGFDSPRNFAAGLGLASGNRTPDIYFVPHHRAHASSAFHASGLDHAAVLVVDANGEDESISIFRARRGEPLVRLQSWPRASSLGYLYEMTSKWLGLSLFDAGKTMGLAAYGRFREQPLPQWFEISHDELRSAAGTDPDLDYQELRKFWGERIAELVHTSRTSTAVTQLHEDPLSVQVAWAAQATVELVLPWLAERARQLVGVSELCIAGGVGLNCAANGRLAGPVFVPPVPHDAGVALGAAWSLLPPSQPEVFSPYTGGLPGALDAPIDQLGGITRPLDVDRVADLLMRGQIGAVCRGRSEVGPRALCHRSLLASPIESGMQDRLNSVKRRERWRPFGPVSNADQNFWKSAGELERYMVGAATVTDVGAQTIPAVRHVDGTTRPQRLTGDQEPFVDALLTQLGAQGHPPVLINTSFNGPQEPIVESAAEAMACASKLGVDFLVLNDDLILLGKR